MVGHIKPYLKHVRDRYSLPRNSSAKDGFTEWWNPHENVRPLPRLSSYEAERLQSAPINPLQVQMRCNPVNKSESKRLSSGKKPETNARIRQSALTVISAGYGRRVVSVQI
jgi:hypothetical protein